MIRHADGPAILPKAEGLGKYFAAGPGRPLPSEVDDFLRLRENRRNG